MVEGAFARAFKSELRRWRLPARYSARWMTGPPIVAQGRTPGANDFVVEIAET